MSNRRKRRDRYSDATHEMRVDARIMDIKALARFLPITDAQRAALVGVRWAMLDLPDLARRDPADPSNLFFSARVRTASALYLYASDIWYGPAPAPDAMPDPDHVALVWDTRLDDSDDCEVAVPCTVLSRSGRVLKLRAMSEDSSLDWPIERGERVFVPHTPTSAAHLSLGEIDRLTADAPHRLDKLVSRAGSIGAVRKLIEAWVLDKGLADLSHATDPLVEDIRERQSLITAMTPVIAAVLDGFTARVTKTGGAGDDATPADTASGAVVLDYTNIVYGILRADLGRDGPIHGMLGVEAETLRRYDGSAALMVRGSGHCDENGNALSRDLWAAMRRDRDYCVKYNAYYMHPESPEYMLEVSAEWFGALVETRVPSGATAAFDVGIAILVRFVSRDLETKFPWLVHHYWERDADQDEAKRVVAELSGGHALFDGAAGLDPSTVERVTDGKLGGGVATKSAAVKNFMHEVLDIHARFMGMGDPFVPVPGASKRGQA